MARGKYKGPKRGAGQRQKAGVGEDDEDERRVPAQQGGRAGMMPDSDSDEDDDAPKALNMFGGMGAPGDLPPNSSDEDSDSDDSDIAPHGAPSAPEPPRRRNKNEDDPDPEQIRKDMERLALIKQKREQERLDRIKQEGWDRFAPVSETNKPPGGRAPPVTTNDDDDESDDED